jgi:hypothetical protein
MRHCSTAMWRCRGQGNRDVVAQWFCCGEHVRLAGQVLPVMCLLSACRIPAAAANGIDGASMPLPGRDEGWIGAG